MPYRYGTVATSVRQYPGPQEGETTTRLARRYGPAALDGGYAAIPHVVLRYRRRLGITASEWDYITELWHHWRSECGPTPSVALLAIRLGVDESTVRRYRASLAEKRLLHVQRIDGRYVYDLRPLLDAAVALAEHDSASRGAAGEQLEADAAPAASTAMAHGVHGVHGVRGRAERRAESRPTKEIEEPFDKDLDTPYPLHRALATDRGAGTDFDRQPVRGSPRTSVGNTMDGACAGGEARSCDAPSDGSMHDQGERALAALTAAVSAHVGDLHPRSSLTRVRTLFHGSGLDAAAFAALLHRATERTLAHKSAIYLIGPDRAVVGMPYFFRTLENLLRPPAVHRRADRLASRYDRGYRRSAHAPSERVTCVDHEPMTETHPIWRTLLEEVRLIMTAANFNTWLAGTRLMRQDGTLLSVSVPDPFHKYWLENKLQARILTTLERLGYSDMRVRYVVRIDDSVADYQPVPWPRADGANVVATVCR